MTFAVNFMFDFFLPITKYHGSDHCENDREFWYFYIFEGAVIQKAFPYGGYWWCTRRLLVHENSQLYAPPQQNSKQKHRSAIFS